MTAAQLGPITAVIVNFDGALHLPHCLRALAAQTLQPDEVLLVDNASTDGSERLADELLPRARTIRLSANRGPCPARNTGLATARHSWVLLLDNDAVLAPDALEKLARAAAAAPEAALLQPRSVFDSEPDRVHYDGGEPHYVGVFALRNFYAPLAGAEGAGVVEVGGAVSVALLARRDVVLAAGGFDPAFFILFEDLDLSLRLRQRGHRILSVEDALVRHRGGTAGISFRSGPRYPDSRAFFHARNRGLVLLKCYAWRTLFVALPGILAYQLVWLAFVIGNRSFLAHARGRLALCLALPRTLRARRGIQAARKVRDRDLLVGGPLTVTPGLGSSGVRAAAIAGLDRCLRAWWRLARPFAG